MTGSGGNILLGLGIFVGVAIFFLVGAWRIGRVRPREDRPRAAGAILMTLAPMPPPSDDQGSSSGADGGSGSGNGSRSV